MSEINLLENYPKTLRKVEERAQIKTEEDRRIGRLFGQEYFDGDRRFGYGGYTYHPRFWKSVVSTIIDYYGLDDQSSILDVGCGKGFMLHDFAAALPGITLRGVDISSYAIEQTIEDMKPFVSIGNAKELPFKDRSFDLVISISTLHNLPLEDCKKALDEIQRVSRRDAFITVDAYRNEEEKKKIEKWSLTALTYMHVEDWKKLFKEVRYTGDYYWIFP